MLRQFIPKGHRPAVGDDWLSGVTSNPEHAALVRALGARSVMAVPLVARAETLGAITLVCANRRYTRIDLATAIHKMTGLPADTFGLHDRGRIAPGHVADLVAFTDNTIADHGDYRDPVHPPSGLAWVMQAGDVVVDSGRWLGVRRGQRLLPSAA